MPAARVTSVKPPPGAGAGNSGAETGASATFAATPGPGGPGGEHPETHAINTALAVVRAGLVRKLLAAEFHILLETDY
jgi:hypothetical protein